MQTAVRRIEGIALLLFETAEARAIIKGKGLKYKHATSPSLIESERLNVLQFHY